MIQGPWPGAISSISSRLQERQRVHEGGERVAARRHDRRAEAEDEVAAEADAGLGQEADVVLGVAGGGEDAQREVLLAAGGQDDLGAELVAPRRCGRRGSG